MAGRWRLVRVDAAGGARWGLLEEDLVYALEGDPWPSPRRGALLGRLDELRLEAPVAPSKILCVGRNYGAHAAEHGVEVPSEPLLFLKPPSSIVGPGAEIVRPPQSERVEHEGELALVIGRRVRNLGAGEAWSAVAGATVANDVTARDLQRRDGQWTRGKGFDTFCPVGPWVVGGLAEADLADVEVVCRVNGEVRQRGRTSEMAFPPAAIVAYASSIMTLQPGDLLLTGTPSGVGPLASGDVVEVAVTGLGELRNPVR